VRWDVKIPVPVPLEVIPILLVIVGVCEVLHTTPRAVTAAPPSEVILPPVVAVVAVILVILFVVIVGIVGANVVNDFSLP
jgi:hypothetical protein